jgi:nicotinamide-nucleotide amidase
MKREPSDERLFKLAGRVGQQLLRDGARVTTAESCTAGWITKVLTDIAGSSQWVDCGFVTYSNAAKVRVLGVRERTLKRHGAVSEATVREMAVGALRVSGADLAVAVSGIAGPDGGTPDKPVGTVWFGVGVRHGKSVRASAEMKRFKGDRDSVRRKSVEHALRLLLKSGD